MSAKIKGVINGVKVISYEGKRESLGGSVLIFCHVPYPRVDELEFVS